MEKAQLSVSATEANLHAVDKRKLKPKPKQCDVTPARQNWWGCDYEKPKCDKCGLIHKPKESPAFRKQCYKCGKTIIMQDML